MRPLVFAAALILAALIVVRLVTGLDDGGPERFRGQPIRAAADAPAERGEIVVARGTYSDGESFEVYARRDGAKRLCIRSLPGVAACGPMPRPMTNRQMTVYYDESGCPDTMILGLTVPETERVTVALAGEEELDAYLFPLPRSLEHEGQLFAAAVRGSQSVGRVVAHGADGTTVGEADASGEIDDAGLAC